MTNLEALRHSVAITVHDDALDKILIDSNITGADTYTGKSRAFDLAKADLLVHIISQPNVSEGGYSISLTDKESLGKQAAQLYALHDEINPLQPVIRDASNRW